MVQSLNDERLSKLKEFGASGATNDAMLEVLEGRDQWNDTIVAYLRSLGYTGAYNDMFREFIVDSGYDNERDFWEGLAVNTVTLDFHYPLDETSTNTDTKLQGAAAYHLHVDRQIAIDSNLDLLEFATDVAVITDRGWDIRKGETSTHRKAHDGTWDNGVSTNDASFVGSDRISASNGFQSDATRNFNTTDLTFTSDATGYTEWRETGVGSSVQRALQFSTQGFRNKLTVGFVYRMVGREWIQFRAKRHQDSSSINAGVVQFRGDNPAIRGPIESNVVAFDFEELADGWWYVQTTLGGVGSTTAALEIDLRLGKDNNGSPNFNYQGDNAKGIDIYSVYYSDNHKYWGSPLWGETTAAEVRSDPTGAGMQVNELTPDNDFTVYFKSKITEDFSSSADTLLWAYQDISVYPALDGYALFYSGTEGGFQVTTFNSGAPDSERPLVLSSVPVAGEEYEFMLEVTSGGDVTLSVNSINDTVTPAALPENVDRVDFWVVDVSSEQASHIVSNFKRAQGTGWTTSQMRDAT
jgi:hypothetical protein